MISRSPLFLFAAVGALCATLYAQPCDAFAVVKPHAGVRASPTALSVFGGGKKKPVEDLSSIESRDMTREEMQELNKKNEEIMNMELGAMTAFSAVISLPLFYLVWVAFFSD